jgi:hypothetical protein
VKVVEGEGGGTAPEGREGGEMMQKWSLEAFSKYLICGNCFEYFILTDGMLII